MKLLLDSHVLLWWSRAVPDQLSVRGREQIQNADALFVSVATVWELEIKRQAGRLDITQLDWSRLEQDGISNIAIDRDDALASAALPLLHRDPFDRMIVAQAMRRQLTLVTHDRALSGYGVPILEV